MPTVTLVLYAYNEERFIRESILSIFAQTYSPLEIIISDDGSTDRTYEIMLGMAESYVGPHVIKLNRNPQNIGIGSQINAAVAMSQGELIVLANADDISKPERVQQTVDAWLTEYPRPTAVWSALQHIDEFGHLLSRVMDLSVAIPSNLAEGTVNRFCGGGAASLALDRRVFTEFGPLPDNLILEDSPLFARAVLLGKISYIEEPLVLYRVHAKNLSQTYAVADFEVWRKRNRNKILWQKTESVKAYLQILRDYYHRSAENWDRSDLENARWLGMEKLVENVIQRDYYAGNSMVSDFIKLRSLLRLVILILVTSIKRHLPFIEKRNDRWHYRRAVVKSEEVA